MVNYGIIFDEENFLWVYFCLGVFTQLKIFLTLTVNQIKKNFFITKMPQEEESINNPIYYAKNVFV